MTDKLKPLLDLIHQAIAQAKLDKGGISDEHMQALALELLPLVRQQAPSVMRGRPGGLDLADAHDLASAGLLHLVEPEHLRILLFKGQTEGELATFVRTTLRRLLIDDVRKLVGRGPEKENAKSLGDAEPHEPGGDPDGDEADELPPLSDEQRASKAKASPYVPRVYVDVVDDEGHEFLLSQRRSATGYLLLKQTQRHLHEYLALMPGTVVQVPYGPRSKKVGAKKVTLHTNHAALLRMWLSGEGDAQWSEIAAQMGTALGNAKRWWAEAVAAFQLDDSPQAQALRSLYRIHPDHTRRASDAMDAPEEGEGGDAAAAA